MYHSHIWTIFLSSVNIEQLLNVQIRQRKSIRILAMISDCHHTTNNNNNNNHDQSVWYNPSNNNNYN